MTHLVGFDLGTHQTKICIQDATNPAEKIYEFLEFEMPEGGSTVLFPSIVQINIDKTVSYGFVDNQSCMELSGVVPEKPELKLLDRPVNPRLSQKKKAKYPKKPKNDWKDELLKMKGEMTPHDKWKEECARIDAVIDAEWEKQCAPAIEEHKKTVRSNQSGKRGDTIQV